MNIKQSILVAGLVMGLQSSAVLSKDDDESRGINFTCWTHGEQQMVIFDIRFAKLNGPAASKAMCADALVASGRAMAFNHGEGPDTHTTPEDCVQAYPDD